MQSPRAGHERLGVDGSGDVEPRRTAERLGSVPPAGERRSCEGDEHIVGGREFFSPYFLFCDLGTLTSRSSTSEILKGRRRGKLNGKAEQSEQSAKAITNEQMS